MDAVKVDNTNRIRLTMLAPGSYYVPENVGTDDILLHKVPPPRRHITVEQARKNFAKSKLKFNATWDEMKTYLR